MEDIDANMIIDDFAEAERKGSGFPKFSGGLAEGFGVTPNKNPPPLLGGGPG